MAISDVLSALRKEKGLSQAQVAAFLSGRGLSLTQKGVSKWERGDTAPNAEQFLLLCELYEVRDVLSVFMAKPGDDAKLNALGQSRVAEYRSMLLSSDAFRRAAEPALPLYDMNAAYPSGLSPESSVGALPASKAPSGAEMGLIIRGDSMSPLFEDRQTVFLKGCVELSPGDFGVFLLNGRLCCKLYMRSSGAELVSVNERFPPVSVREDDDFHIVGKVLL